MSDPTDNGQRNPLSSSSSHASGTGARRISAQPDQKPNAAHADQDDPAPARPPVQGVADATGQDEHTGRDDEYSEAGSEPQADQAEQGVADHSQFPAPLADQHSMSTESEEAGILAPSYEPAADNYTNDTQPAIERQFEHSTGHDIDRQPAALYDAAPDDENDADYTQPAAEYYSEPTAEHHSAPAARSDVDDLKTPDEPAYATDAADALDAASPGTSAGKDESWSGSLPNGTYPEATGELRAAVRETIAENEARQEQTLALFDQVSRRFTAVLEEAGVDAARVTFKVMEFAQASLKNNLELAKSYAAARSVPDIFGLHAAYMARQFELLNAQAEELREMTSKFALRNAASLTPQADRDRVVKAPDHR